MESFSLDHYIFTFLACLTGIFIAAYFIRKSTLDATTMTSKIILILLQCKIVLIMQTQYVLHVIQG